MSEIGGILVCGLNGAGKTTLARELARLLGYKHMDIEEYCFLPSDIPYTRPRPQDACNALMLADIQKHPHFVLSAVIGDFGEEILRRFDLAVLLSVPKEIRMARINQREIDKYGNRVLEGGDLYEQQKRFHAFAAARPTDYAAQWAKTLTCPVLCIDGTRDVHETAQEIAESVKGKTGLFFDQKKECGMTILSVYPDQL
jgi:adenylate kinase family enzyme